MSDQLVTRERMTSELLAYMEKLEARIRELEADKAAYMKDVDDIGKERNLYEERIQKAREILEDGWRDNNPLAMREALEALEGK